LIVNSQGEELVVLNRALEVEKRIPARYPWIQDAMPLPDGHWLVADVNHFRVVAQDDSGTIRREYPFNRDWRVYGIGAVPAHLARGLHARQPVSLAGRYDSSPI
jgi:hypothetical protein